ncbi:MAG: PDZ domain-containing protein [Anaerolinea sp.]|nr:PDZ domain-containing protein [Anaerolinea sp.]
MQFKRTCLFASLLLLVLAVTPAFAQDELPDAEIQDDEGGVVFVTGQLAYSNPTLPDFGTQPIVFLGDMSEIFGGEFVFSTEYINLESPQFLATITSPITESPFTFELRLPIDPGGVLADVDNDGESDTGVSLYNLNFTFNGVGDPFVDNREFIYYRSSSQSLDYETLYQVNGGRVLVWSPDAEQGFPSGFGDDGELFTEDDPTVGIPEGWTVVDLDTEPFTFIRSREAEVDIIESAGEELPDFSDMGYTEAFSALLDMMENEYAFSEFKEVDWEAIRAEYMPLFEQAEADNDSEAYQLALEDFAENAIPDGHIAVASQFLVAQGLPADIMGGLGIAIVELSDGRFIVNYIGENSPASDEGIEPGAEILDVNGVAVADAIEDLPGLNPPYSSDTLRRLEQIRQVMRFNVGDEVEITYQNPGDSEATTVTLTAVEESASRLASRNNVYGVPRGSNLPVEYEVLENGYGYIAIYSFSDDFLVSVLLWQRALALFNALEVPGIIIDMRYNNGGSPDISNPMLGYLFDEEVYAGTSAFYFPDRGAFEINPLYETTIEPAPNEADRYRGPIAVLISPACFSNCEFFTYALTLRDDVAVVGYYPTGGLGGGIQQFAMPDGVFGQFTVGRALGADNEIHIEGTGVEPTLVVPVTEDTVFSEGDPLLDAAVEWLDEQQ